MAHNAFAKIKRIQQEAQAFLDEKGIEHEEQFRRSRWRRLAHFSVLVAKSFVRNRCPVRASALAYSTLLALIPMLAVVLSVTTSILKQQGEEPIRQFVNKLVEHITPYTNARAAAGDASSEKALAEAAVAREEAVRKIHEFISRTQSGTIGVTGTIALVLVAILMLSRIETTFNDIWGVSRGRSWYMRVVLYWATITLGPVLIITALGLTSGPHLEGTRNLVMAMPFIGKVFFRVLPLLVLCLTFALFYQLIPNTRVRFSAAAVGGLVAGLLWHLNNLLSVNFVSRITSNNAVYGSLGMVPVFMIGLYFGWLILLFGAQVAYAFQNRQAYLQEKQMESINQRGREFVALRMLVRLARHFQRGEKAPGVSRLANELGVPLRLVSQVGQTLLQSRIIVEVLDGETGYAPARPLDQITAHDVLQAMRAGQGQELATAEDSELPRVRGEYDRVSEAERQVAQEVTLLDLVNGTEAGLPSPKAGTP